LRILFDIAHPAHVNFFRNSVRQLQEDGHETFVTAIDRGPLLRILDAELGLTAHKVGRHRGNKISIIFEANALKFVNLARFVIRNRIEVGVSVGGFVLGAVMKLAGRPNLQFDDDPESGANAFLEKLTATRLYYPGFAEPGGIVATFNSLKEWAYLSPSYFVPDPGIPAAYGLLPREYFFVREVNTGSFYYSKQTPNLVAGIAADMPNATYVLSLENKKTADLYPPEWTLLQEPIRDIHSLMYFSRAVLSSGDSMAREAAMMGVDSIYCGIRKMQANDFLLPYGRFAHVPPAEVAGVFEGLLKTPFDSGAQDESRTRMANEWCDTSRFVVEQILELTSEGGK